MKVKAAKLLNKYVEVSNDELKLLQQKAKIKWPNEGDNVADVFVKHFKKFLRSKHDVHPLDSVEVSFDKVLTEKEVKDMICLVTNEEIKEDVFDIDNNKAFGPDGYTLGFFKKACNIIAKEEDIFKIIFSLLKSFSKDIRRKMVPEDVL
nr:hypothetical protein [Tanacetum cinerariifolium]